MKEIEIKVRVEESQELIAFLSKEAKLVKKERQIDEYFSPADADKSFVNKTPIKEWLRLRSEDGQSSINYKFWHYNADGKSNHCDEYETAVGDPKQIRSILLALGFIPLVTVDKKRRSYLHEDYEISIDDVKSLGSFVEIELKTMKDVDPKVATDQMMTFLERFHPGRVERDYQGYPKLLLD